MTGRLRVILHRCFAWDERAGDDGPDGPLWFPRIYQGEGRHDNPDRYGCLYLSHSPLSTVVEQLARFRGQRLLPSLLRRRGLPLALAELELDDDAELVDLDDPWCSGASVCGPRSSPLVSETSRSRRHVICTQVIPPRLACGGGRPMRRCG